MVHREKSYLKGLIKMVLVKISFDDRAHARFIAEAFWLFLAVKDRINFLRLGRFGPWGEQTFRSRFARPFDFMAFNTTLAAGTGKRAIAIDPSYIRKSGKCTPGTGRFWSGVAGAAKWGLEIMGMAVVDIRANTAHHLEAVQTPSDLGDGTLLDHYARVVVARAERLLGISAHLVADAYFSKRPFVDAVTGCGMHLTSRLRDDADLCYLYRGGATGGRGRPRKYDGKVDFADLKEEHFTLVEDGPDQKLSHGKVWSKALKREINLTVAKTLRKGEWSHKLYFTTDPSLSAMEILEQYRCRFQIEFLFRDAKQHTSLEHCQSRDPKAMHFHWNASLTAVNLAKELHWSRLPVGERGAFSMAGAKTLYNNALVLERFLEEFGICPNRPKNRAKIQKLLCYGARAA